MPKPESYVQLCASEVAWYLRNGRHGQRRISTNANGVAYVIGDFSWNRKCCPCEVIEKQMDRERKYIFE